MDALIETVRAAFADDATPETRAAGAVACRTILKSLAPTPTEPAASQLPVKAIVSALRGMPADQLLDMAIARLRAALPAGAELAPVKPLAFQLVPLPGATR